METMKYPNVSGTNMAVSGGGNNTGHHVDEVDSLFTSPCWQNSATNLQSDFMDTHKLILDSSISNLGSDKMLLDASIGPDDNEIETKATMDALDNLLLSSQQTMAELKPLPPFTGYTANLSINGIQGHHYHTISQRCLPEENNNNSYNNSYNDHNNIVSSSTCNVVVNADSAGGGAADSSKLYVDDIKLGYSNSSSGGGSGGGAAVSDVVVSSVECHKNNDIEYDKYDITSIEDIAAIIGSAIADTTVPNDNNISGEDPNASRDSWMDLDAWIDGACGAQKNNIIISQDGLSDFNINSNTSTNSDYTNNNNNSSSKMQSAPPAPPAQQTSTLQTLLTHGYMPLLQNRLQNGPPIKQETPTSTNYNSADLISTSSPPANVVSTTDNMLMNINGRYMAAYSLDSDHPHHRSTSLRSPEDLMQNYPHTTTGNPAVTSNASKKSRSRAQKKAAAAAAAAAAAVAQQNAQAAAQQQQAATSTVFQAEQSSLGLLGKEKPVHRCNICNRGFLNKSNIKVHLRTHTGEKPFRCDTCAKAFRQKAHLLKHQQIHKRIGRD